MQGRTTRYRIMAAFLYLLERQEFDDITVSMIASKCGISRQAFYNNFDNKEDMCVQIIATLFRDCLRGKERFTWEDIAGAYLGQMERYMEFFHAVTSPAVIMTTGRSLFLHISRSNAAMVRYSLGAEPDADLSAVIRHYSIGVTYSYLTLLVSSLVPDRELVTGRLRMAMPEALGRLLLGVSFPISVHRDLYPGREDDALERLSACLEEFSAGN